MNDPLQAQRFGIHDNIFGFVRLLFASLVVLAHAAEIIDGDRSREMLTQIFGTISFGEFAVYGFFIISGFLITSSYLGSRSALDYLLKRIGRIYPGFVICFGLCILVVAPIAGGDSFIDGAWGIFRHAVDMILLLPPIVDGVFAGTHHPALNGSMWTISYEFLCYIGVMIAGWIGLLSRPRLILTLWLLLLAGTVFWTFFPPLNGPLVFIGHLTTLGAFFLSGVCFTFYRDRFPPSALGIGLAAVVLIAGLSVPHIAEIAMATCGAYLIFSIASVGGGTFLRAINNRNDISYGVYLYGWPVTKLLLLAWPGMGLAALSGWAVLLSIICGWISWIFIERPALQLVRRLNRRPSVPVRISS